MIAKNLKIFLGNYKYEILSFFVTLVVCSLLFLFNDFKFSNDDQFVNYIYINNAVSGHGLVFNIGESVMGYTSPLFLLLGLLFKFILSNLDVQHIISGINVFLMSLSAVFFYRICKKFVSTKFSLFSVLVFALILARTIPEGMETPLFFLTVFVFLDALLSQRYYISSVFLALAILTRPDAGLIAVLALIFWWQKVGLQKTIKLVTVCIAVALPWLIFATFYYGSFIPQSILAKMDVVTGLSGQSSLQAFKVQLSDMSRIYWGKIFDPDNIKLQVIFNLLPLLVVVFLGIKKYLSKDNWIIFAIPFLYFIAISLANPFMFVWYLSQIEPFWVLMFLLGFFYLISFVKNYWLRSVAALLIIAGPLYWWIGKVVIEQKSEGSYVQIGEYLKDNISSGDKVGTNAVGIIGFLTGAYIFDFYGLMNYDATAFYEIKEYCKETAFSYTMPSNLIIYAKPDWLVATENELVSCFKGGGVV